MTFTFNICSQRKGFILQQQLTNQSHRRESKVRFSNNVGSTFSIGSGKLLATALAFALSASLPVLEANAVLVSPNAQIARSADVALRRSIPAFNKDLYAVRQQVENIGTLLRIPQRKNWGAMLVGIDTCLEIVTDNDGQTVLQGTPSSSEEQALQLWGSIVTGLERVRPAIQERDADAVSIRISKVLGEIGNLEILQAPGLPYLLPREYTSLPYLKGRATIQFTIERNSSDMDELQVTVDGYSAPLTGGNFVRRVLNGEYDGTILKDNSVSLLVQGNADKLQKYTLPLEILPLGGFEPIYKSPLETQDGELPVLPLSIYGSVAMSQSGSDGDSFVSPTDWFIYKFDRSQAGLAGLAFDEGRFGVFGYVTKGLQKLGSLQNGDKILKAEVVQGKDQLVIPEQFQ
eukprot:TRINITY_DN3380_c1_g1_i2.p2 TRINITY_DN3380_c1_g1~~TRINITY_DN3380_c1_g1_i2.p2  ORF type:complete len:411 (-),score=43.15 TRINITY_DN3380_c1_g1_i2:103-1311(-)